MLETHIAECLSLMLHDRRMAASAQPVPALFIGKPRMRGRDFALFVLAYRLTDHWELLSSTSRRGTVIAPCANITCVEKPATGLALRR